jgi:hypothetical protein
MAREESALIYLHGDTEEEFFKKVFDKYLKGVRRHIKNIKGDNRKVLSNTAYFLSGHSNVYVRVYCFLDRESRYGTPPLNEGNLIKIFHSDPRFEKRVLSCNVIIATQMIESWFFYDIEGIYRYLKVPRRERHTSKYSPPERFSCYDLSKLFARYGKAYIKGKKCACFVDHLDIDRIHRNCQNLRDGIALIMKYNSLSNRKK